MTPTRFANVAAARARFGDRVDRLAPYLLEGDPLADDAARALADLPRGQASQLIDDAARAGVAAVAGAPHAVRAFFTHAERVPPWVDFPTIDRGGEVLVRTAWVGGTVLAVKSLVTGYASPGGNKPLAWSGRLREQATQRVNETAHFVRAVCRPGGLRQGQEGYRITLRVRLMHAQVRRMIRATGRFREDAWGVPINQHDMAATSLLFSSTLLDGMRTLGIHVSPDEAERYMHLWRYAGHLIGVDPSLQPTCEQDAQRLAEVISATQGPPDDDSRALTAALLAIPQNGPRGEPRSPRAQQHATGFAGALCRALVGDEMADGLALPDDGYQRAIPVVRRAVQAIEVARRTLPGGERAAIATGERYWDAVVNLGLGGRAASFDLPQAKPSPSPRAPLHADSSTS